MGVKPESHFPGADLQVSGYGKFQSSQAKAVFELMTQEGAALKSWIYNWSCRWTVPPWCMCHWAVGKIIGKQTQRMCCFSRAKSLKSFVCHVRANNVLFWLTWRVVFHGQTSKPCSPSEPLLIFWLPIWIWNKKMLLSPAFHCDPEGGTGPMCPPWLKVMIV